MRKNGGGMWPQWGAGTRPHSLPAAFRTPVSALQWARQKLPALRVLTSVDRRDQAGLYKPVRRAVCLTGAIARLRSSSLTTVTRLPILVGGLGLRMLSGLPGTGPPWFRAV